MAEVTLTHEEATSGNLPMVCMRCGDAAFRLFTLRQFWLLRARLSCRVPLCEIHSGRRTWLTWCLAVVGVSVFLLMLGHIIVGHILQSHPPWERVYRKYYLVPGFVLLLLNTSALVVGLAMSAILQQPMLRAKPGAKGAKCQFQFIKVAPEFAAALEAHRKANAAATLENGQNASMNPLVATVLAHGGVSLAEESERIVLFAVRLARKHHHDHIGSWHLLLALRMNIPSVAAYVLKAAGIEPDQLLAQVGNIPPALDTQSPVLVVTPFVRRACARASKEARDHAGGVLSSEHLLRALLEEHDGESSGMALECLGGTEVPQRILRELNRRHGATSEAIVASPPPQQFAISE